MADNTDRAIFTLSDRLNNESGHHQGDLHRLLREAAASVAELKAVIIEMLRELDKFDDVSAQTITKAQDLALDDKPTGDA